MHGNTKIKNLSRVYVVQHKWSHELGGDQTRASAVRGLQLIDWGTARPFMIASYCYSYVEIRKQYACHVAPLILADIHRRFRATCRFHNLQYVSTRLHSVTSQTGVLRSNRPEKLKISQSPNIFSTFPFPQPSGRRTNSNIRYYTTFRTVSHL